MRIQTQNRKPDLHLAFNIIYKKCDLKEHSINSTYFNLSFQFLARQDYSCLKIQFVITFFMLPTPCLFLKNKNRTSQLPPLLLLLLSRFSRVRLCATP